MQHEMTQTFPTVSPVVSAVASDVFPLDVLLKFIWRH